MPNSAVLTDLEQLRSQSRQLSLEQLLKLQSWVQELLAERSNLVNQKCIERHQKDMRAQMAKAGISWDEFQAALGETFK